MDKAPPPLLASAPPSAPSAPEVVLRCQAALLAHPRLEEGATALAVELAELLRCRRVSVGLLDGERLSIAGSSQPTDLDPRHDAAAAITAAMHEALDQSLTVAWPTLADDAPVLLSQ